MAHAVSNMIWAGLVLWIHLMATVFWVGGQFFLVAVVLPVLREHLPDAERTRVTGRVGRRFAILSAAALVVLLVTGPLNTVAHGVSWTILRDTPWGHVLVAKSALVAAVVAVTAVHGGYYGRRLEQLAISASAGDSVAAARRKELQRQSLRLSALNLGLNLLIVALAVWMAMLP